MGGCLMCYPLVCEAISITSPYALSLSLSIYRHTHTLTPAALLLYFRPERLQALASLRCVWHLLIRHLYRSFACQPDHATLIDANILAVASAVSVQLDLEWPCTCGAGYAWARSRRDARTNAHTNNNAA
jgi:hypothetical protein